jgi:MFS transporter, FSR family, fosmidomycin resistance protein
MTSQSIPIQKNQTKDTFQTGLVIPLAFSHFIHDIYTATLAPLLPVIIDKLSLSLTAAGSLPAILQLPSIINPFIGYMADKVNLRYLTIFAPAVTATLISCLSFANSYWVMALLLFVTGFSVACYHAPTPALIANSAGSKVGLGMSLYMAAGELSRTVGPLIAVWAISIWSLEGFYRIVVIGWATTIVLFLRLRDIPNALKTPPSIKVILPTLQSLFIPLALINLFRSFMLESITTYLPIYMNSQGASLTVSGGALSILELAGVIGTFTSGTISDRFGRRLILLLSIVLSAGIMFIFLNTSGWLYIPILVILGFTAISTGPVMLAMVQDHLPENRSLGNSLLMFITFLTRPLAMLSIGLLSDNFGLKIAFTTGTMISLLAIPAIIILPKDVIKNLNN